MANTKTLYDILRVSRNATKDEIDSAFELLRNTYEAGRLHSDDLDPVSRFNLIKDAHRTLANSELRARYDARQRDIEALRQGMDRGNADFAYRDSSGNGWKWACILVLLVAGGTYYHIHESNKAEKLRLEQEAAEARAQAAQLAREQNEHSAQEREERERSSQLQEQLAASRRQNDAISYSNNIQYNLRTAEKQAALEDTRKRNIQDMQRQRQTIEAAQRAAIERNQLSQIDSRPQKTNIIASPQSGSHSSSRY